MSIVNTAVEEIKLEVLKVVNNVEPVIGLLVSDAVMLGENPVAIVVVGDVSVLLEDDPEILLLDVVENPVDVENNVFGVVDALIAEVIVGVLIDDENVVPFDDEGKNEVVKKIKVDVVGVVVIDSENEEVELETESGVIEVEAWFVLVGYRVELVIGVAEDPCCWSVVVEENSAAVVVIFVDAAAAEVVEREENAT